MFTVIVAILTLMLALAGGPAALAATKRLPIRSGPHGLSRTPGAITPKIVGGTPVPNGKYKFQAALLAQSFGNNDFQRQYCGGSLITPFEVLTAAHCVDFVGVPGGIPLSVLTSTQGQKRRAVAIDIHPRWDPATFSFDAAVIHLASPINGIAPRPAGHPGR
jgi:secreted trypsin-like serine protease